MTVLLSENQQKGILLCAMLLTGSIRATVSKLYFQLGFEDPLFMTLLELFAQALAFPLYFYLQWLMAERVEKLDDKHPQEQEETLKEPTRIQSTTPALESKGPALHSSIAEPIHKPSTSFLVNETGEREDCTSSTEDSSSSSWHQQHAVAAAAKDEESNLDPLNLRASFTRSNAYRSLRHFFVQDLVGTMIREVTWTPTLLDDDSFGTTEQQDGCSRGPSNRSLLVRATHSIRSTFSNQEKEQHLSSDRRTAVEDDKNENNPSSRVDAENGQKKQVHWALRMPKYTRPFMGSFLRLCDTVVNMFAFLYLPASLAELSIRGIELIVSVFVQKFIRGRTVSGRRWLGVAIVSGGLMVVLSSELTASGEAGSSSPRESTVNLPLGMLAVVCKAATGVSDDMLGEIIMKETLFPPILLLGYQGLYGLVMAIPLYCVVGPFLGYYPVESFQAAAESVGSIAFCFFLIMVFHSFWMSFLIVVGRTSVVTVNMAAGLRGLIVWFIEERRFRRAVDGTWVASDLVRFLGNHGRALCLQFKGPNQEHCGEGFQDHIMCIVSAL